MKSSVIYLTDNLIRVADSGDNPDKPRVAEIDLSALKKEEIPHAIRNLLKANKIQTEYLILGVPRTKVNIRYFSFPSINDNELRSMMGYDLASRFAYKEDELVFDQAVIGKSEDGFSRVLLAAVPRDEMLSEFSLLKHAGLIPDQAALSTMSLFNQHINRKKDLDKCLLVYFDDGFVEVLYIGQAALQFSRAISFKTQEPEILLQEIKRTATVLNIEGKLIEKVIVAGKSSAVAGFAELLKKILGLSVEIDDSLDALKGFLLENGPIRISLLPEEYKIRKVKERRARSLVYLGILLLLNVSLIANIAWFKIKAKDGYLYALKAEIKKIESRAVALQKKMVKARALREYINSGKIKLGLLSEIYRSAPEGVLLSSMDISGNKGQGVIVLIGQAPDSESVLKFANALKSSAFIRKSDVNYINKRKLPGQSASDFEIRAGF
jgi:hypothetical protein